MKRKVFLPVCSEGTNLADAAIWRSWRSRRKKAGAAIWRLSRKKPDVTETEQADILILGPGCKNCQGLEQNVKEALKKMGRDVEIAHVTDFGKIAAYGIMSTPGLVVKGKVVSSGKVLKVDAIVELLEKNL